MGMFSKVVFSSLVSLFSVNALADSLVNCVSIKGTSIQLSYSIKGTASKRLASDLLLVKNGTPSLIFNSSVAQYASTNVLLYVLTDDGAENPKIRLTAVPTKANQFLGTIEEFGASTTTTAVKCTTSAI